MQSILSRLFARPATSERHDLYIGPDPTDMTPVEPLSALRNRIDALIAEQSPERIYCMTTTGNLDAVREALQYLAELGGEVGAAPQLPDEEVAEIFGVDVDTYRAARDDPDGDAGTF